MIERFTQALAALLPQGYAWPRHPDSVLMRVIRAIAGMHVDLDALTTGFTRQWLPQVTSTRLGEWEACCGLPDSYMPANQTVEQRRAQLLARLRGPVLPYEDSSPAALEVIEAELLAAGYVVTLIYGYPARVGRARCGDRLGGERGVLIVRVAGVTVTTARVGVARCGDRLSAWSVSVPALMALLERLIPARFAYTLILED